MLNWVRFNFETVLNTIIPIRSVKWVDFGKIKKMKPKHSSRRYYKTTRSIVFVFDGDINYPDYDTFGEEPESALERITTGNDIVSIDICMFKESIELYVPWVAGDPNDFTNALQRGKKLNNGDYLLTIKGNDVDMSPDEFLAYCEKTWIESHDLRLSRSKPKKRGLSRRYFDRNIPFEMLKYPKKKDFGEYAMRVIEYYDNLDADNDKLLKEDLEYNTLSDVNKKIEDNKSRNYLNLNLDWSDMGLPRNHSEYQLWRFRHELYRFKFDNNDYGVDACPHM